MLKASLPTPLRPAWFCFIGLLALLSATCGRAAAGNPAPYPIDFTPGTPAESGFLTKNAGSSVSQETRHADPGQFWVYGFPLTAGAHCRLELELDNSGDTTLPAVTVLGLGNKPLPTRLERNADGALAIIWTVPDGWPMGQRVPVVISAKNSPLTLRSARLSFTDRDNQGIPESLLQWMQAGTADAHPTILSRPNQPYTVAQIADSPTPGLDVQTDAVFLQRSDLDIISQWKARGYNTWTLIPSFAGKDFAAQNPAAVQMAADGKPISIGESIFPAPTPDRITTEQSAIQTMLTSGSEGICLRDPGYWAQAGYENSYKQAWQARYGSPWQAPAGSIDARYQASRLMAALTANRVSTLLQNLSLQSPAARRMVTLSSPLQDAEAGWISPEWQIVTLPAVQDVIARVGQEALDTPVRYNGVRRDLPFTQAYLGYSALRSVTRDLNKRLWFSLDPFEVAPDVPKTFDKDRFEQMVVAALFFGDVNAYQVASLLPNSSLPDDYRAEIANVNAALEEMHTQPHDAGRATDDIGVLVGDTIQWQREGPETSDLDGFYGLAVPLLQRGVPVQVVSLERTVDPGYLNRFRTLLLSYDFQKPLGAPTQAALADWVRRGGSLLFFGGSDAYNAARDTWWQQAKLTAPQADLWTQLGLNLGGLPSTRSAPAEDLSSYRTLPTSNSTLGDQTATLDLTPFAQRTGSVAIRFSITKTQQAITGSLRSAELRINGQIAASFLAGSDVENRFLLVDNRSQYSLDRRIISKGGSWTYQFDNLPRGVPISLTVEVNGELTIQAASAEPVFGHTLLTTNQISGLAELFPRLRIGVAYPATIYPLPAQPTPSPNPSHATANTAHLAAAANETDLIPLYTLRSGGVPVWMEKVGRGLVINVGVAPGFFSSSSRSGGLLRELTRLAYQRAGGIYREPEALYVKRGRYIIVRTFTQSRQVEGRTIDLFSPSLAVAEDRIIPPHSQALLADLGPDDASPHIGFVSGRLQAQRETNAMTAFFVRGPHGTTGVARLHRGGYHLAGARGVDRMGRSVPVTATEDGDTVLLRYPNDPDGVAVRVGWR